MTEASSGLHLKDELARKIKLVLAYDGTDFSGWQRQLGQRTVQEELEKAVEKMHGCPVAIMGAGRTDSGVHAVGQTAHFSSNIKSIPAERFEPALNSLLPKDIRIIKASEAGKNFHARFDARLRRYKYYIRYGKNQLPHLDRYAWRLFKKPDINRLNRMASCLHGELDCSAFASAQDKSHSRKRYIYHAAFYPEGDALVFDIAANAFLWRMVRSITGTLIELDDSKKDEREMKKILDSRDRSLAGATAPAKGLFLWSVLYEGVPVKGPRAEYFAEGEQ